MFRVHPAFLRLAPAKDVTDNFECFYKPFAALGIRKPFEPVQHPAALGAEAGITRGGLLGPPDPPP